MIKVAMIVFVVMGTLLAGIAVTVVLSISSLSNQAMTLIGPVSVIGFLVAAPLSYLVAKKITGSLGRS